MCILLHLYAEVEFFEMTAATRKKTALKPTAYYQVGRMDNKWTINRTSNGHVFCLCRSEAEAIKLAAALNKDCEFDPMHHPTKSLRS